jgi:CelD/BcsL family acetyltransferase involved in cellulose biosynthesis
MNPILEAAGPYPAQDAPLSAVSRPGPKRGQRGMSVVVVEDAAALVEYIPAWEGLAAAALEPNVFHEPWMLLPAIRAFGAGKALRFVLVFADGTSHPQGPGVLCGFFPLQRRRWYKGLPSAGLSLWQHVHCFLGTPLLRAGHAQECLGAFFDWLADDPRGGAVMEFPLVTADGPFARALVDFVHARGHASCVMNCHTRALFRPRENGEAYLRAVLSGERRKKLRRNARLLAAQGKLEYTLLDVEAELDDWIAQFLQVEADGWKGREGTALASSEADRAFFSDVAREAFRRGRLGLFAARLDGRPIAYQCYLRAGPGAFAFKTTFDEAFADFSPGSLLQAELLECLHGTPGLEWMDSCSDSDGYLNHLWTDRRMIQTAVVATGKTPGDLVVSAMPLLKWLKRKLLSMSRRSIHD